MTARFEVGGVGQQVGLIDHQRKMFAPFLGDDAADLRRRLNRAVTRLNDGTDTPTGYAWEGMPQVGAEGES